MVTATLLNPTVPAGVRAERDVELDTTILVASTPSIVTLLAPVKLVPLMVIVVPPRVEPDVGLTLVMVGSETMYVNALVFVAVPLSVVTATFCAPAVPAGVFAVMEVLDPTTTPVASTPPMVTLVAPVKLVPRIVNGVPPKVDPEEGEIDVMVGAGVKYVNALEAVAIPPVVVTVTSLEPADPTGVTAVTKVLDTTETLVAATPPTVTLLAPDKLFPVMLIVVPPRVVPEVGLTLAMVGSGTI